MLHLCRWPDTMFTLRKPIVACDRCWAIRRKMPLGCTAGLPSFCEGLASLVSPLGAPDRPSIRPADGLSVHRPGAIQLQRARSRCSGFVCPRSLNVNNCFTDGVMPAGQGATGGGEPSLLLQKTSLHTGQAGIQTGIPRNVSMNHKGIL